MKGDQEERNGGTVYVSMISVHQPQNWCTEVEQESLILVIVMVVIVTLSVHACQLTQTFSHRLMEFNEGDICMELSMKQKPIQIVPFVG